MNTEMVGDGVQDILEEMRNDTAESRDYADRIEDAIMIPKMGKRYYVVCNEWLYPTESGRDFVDDFDTLEEAIECSDNECEKERANFEENVGGDSLDPEKYYYDGKLTGIILTSKMGLDDYCFLSHIIEVKWIGC